MKYIQWIALVALVITLGGCVTWSPSNRKPDFMKVLVGTTSTPITVTYSNVSSDPLALRGPLKYGDLAVFSVTDNTTGQTYQPAATGTVVATFAPAEKKSYEMKFVALGQAVPSTASHFKTKTVKWKGEGVYQTVDGIIIDSPGNGAALDFGEVDIGTTVTKTVTVHFPPVPAGQSTPARQLNRGSHTPAAVFTTPANFTISGAGPGAANPSGTVTISFKPTAVPEVTDFVIYNGPMSTSFGITLKGRGKKVE